VFNLDKKILQEFQQISVSE